MAPAKHEHVVVATLINMLDRRPFDHYTPCACAVDVNDIGCPDTSVSARDLRFDHALGGATGEERFHLTIVAWPALGEAGDE